MRVFYIIVLILLQIKVLSQNLELKNEWWTPNGDVYTLAKDTQNNVLYLGGEFKTVGPLSPFYGVIDTTGELRSISKSPNGEVRAAFPDRNGGWFVGGEFTRFGDSSRTGIAHLDSNGTLTGMFSNTKLNGWVNCIKRHQNKLYIGGQFSGVGKFKNSGTTVDTLNGEPNFNFPIIEGEVEVSISDDNGGMYLGGSFTKIGDSSRNGLAHITASGNISLFSPKINGRISSMVLEDSILFIGGVFDTINGQSRKNLASYNINQQQLNAWNPQVNNQVLGIAIIDTFIYVNGSFNTIDSLSREGIARFNQSNGMLDTWSINSNAIVINAVVFDDSVAYVGGSFSSIGGQSRNRFAEISLDTAIVMPWNINFNGTIETMLLHRDTLYIGGRFNSVDYQQKGGLVALDKNNKILTNIDFNCEGSVYDLAVNRNILYVGGSFNKIGNESRSNAAAFDLNSKLLTAFNPNIFSPSGGSSVHEISWINQSIFIDGGFKSIGGDMSNNIAVYNLNTNQFEFNLLNVDKAVNDIVFSNTSMFVAGEFEIANKKGRTSILEYDLVNDSITTWNCNVDGPINTVDISGDTIFIGGVFSTINSQSRMLLAAINLHTNTLLPWNPSVNRAVLDLEVVGNSVFIAGEFSSVNSQTRYGIAKVDRNQGGLFAWNPGGAYRTKVLHYANNTLYLGGEFGWVGNQVRTNFAALRVDTAILLPLKTAVGSVNNPYYVRTIQSSGDKLFIGGDFSSIGGVIRNNIAAIDCYTGKATNFNPDADDLVREILILDSSLIIGGEFNNIGGTARPRIAKVAKSGTLLNWNAQASGEVNTTAVKGDTLFVGGRFLSFNNVSNGNLVALDINSASMLSWSPSPTGWVNDIVVHNQQLYVGGEFWYTSGVRRTDFATYNLPSLTLNSSFDPDVSGEVIALNIHNDILYLGGRFTTIDSQTRERAASFDLNNQTLTNWNPSIGRNIHEQVNDIYATDSAVYLGGLFSLANGQSRLNVVEIDTAANLTNWKPIFGWRVNAITGSENLLYVGGEFYKVNDNTQRGFAPYSKCKQIIINDQVRACNSYTWIDGISYYQSNNTARFIKPNNLNGCDTLVQLDLRLAQLDTSISVNSFSLSSNQANANYQWIDCITQMPLIGDTNQTLNVNQNGSYAVIVSNSYCSDTSTCVIIQSVGLKERSSSSSLNVYPNPTNSIISIDYKSKIELIELYDISGRHVLKLELNCVDCDLNLMNLDDGYYLLKVFDEHNIQHQRKIMKVN